MYDSQAKSLLKKKSFNTKPIKYKQFFFEYKSFGHKNPRKKFYIINRYPGAGLFSNYCFVMNQIKFCEFLKLIPVVDMKNFPSIYSEKKKIANVNNSWEYYFKPLNKYSLEEVYKSKNVIFGSSKLYSFMHDDMIDKKIKKYFIKIRIKKEFITLSKKFCKKNRFENNKVLGVHFRGSTYKVAKKHAFPPTLKIMIENVEKLISRHGYNKIFLVTEEIEYLNAFKKHFGKKCIFTNSIRMGNEDLFAIYPRKNHRYQLGKETLIDTIILSECDGLTFVKTNVTSAAQLLSKKKQKIHEIFLGYNSSNKFIARWLWYFKKMLPANMGGLKIIKKN